MTFSYDPPQQTLAEIMSDAANAADEEVGDDPGRSAARFLHEKLMLHGMRHTIDAEAGSVSGRHEVVLRIRSDAALWLAGLLDEAFKPPTT